MRMFWTLFFIGSMLLVGSDVLLRRDGARLTAPPQGISADPLGAPTPKPDL